MILRSVGQFIVFWGLPTGRGQPRPMLQASASIGIVVAPVGLLSDHPVSTPTTGIPEGIRHPRVPGDPRFAAAL
jgi:hypothetical protein